MKRAKAYAFVAVFSILASGLVCADEQPRESFSSVPPPKAGGVTSQGPNDTMGKAESFIDVPPKNLIDPRPAAGRGGKAGPVEVEVRRGDIEIEITIPGDKPKNQPVQQIQKDSEKGNWAEHCKKPENKQACENMQELVKREQEKALSQRNAGKKAKEGHERVREQAQSALEPVVGNIESVTGMLRNQGSGTEMPNLPDMEMGESDTLGTLD